jgi:transketolase
MRRAVVEALVARAVDDHRIVLLTGDLGWSVLEPFAERYPARFVNCGVAEQDMVGVATGLAEAGYTPFVYSITPFATLRPFEQLRDGPALMRLPVRVLGIGGGFDYGPAGPTHHALEDLAAMRLLPGMTVLAPADAPQVKSALDAVWDAPGPVYLRVGKDDLPATPGLDGRFRLGRVEVLREGADALLLATGGAGGTAVEAARLLHAEGVECSVGLAACLAPEPRDDLARLLAAHPLAVTVEEHLRIGGLYSLVADVHAERGLGGRIVPCHVHPERLGPVGSAAWLRARHGLTAEGVAEAVRRARAGTKHGGARG